MQKSRVKRYYVENNYLLAELKDGHIEFVSRFDPQYMHLMTTIAANLNALLRDIPHHDVGR